MTDDSGIKGYHYFVELWGCDSEQIGAVQAVENVLLEAVEACGATYVSHRSHKYSPHGVTSMVLIEESHIAVHTWPKQRYVALDLFTCSKELDAAQAVTIVKRMFGATEHEFRSFERGGNPIGS